MTQLSITQPIRYMDRLFDQIKYHFETAVMLAQVSIYAFLGDALTVFVCCLLSTLTALYVYKKGYFVDKEKRKVDIEKERIELAKAQLEAEILKFEAEKRKAEAQKAQQEADLYKPHTWSFGEDATNP